MIGKVRKTHKKPWNETAIYKFSTLLSIRNRIKSLYSLYEYRNSKSTYLKTPSEESISLLASVCNKKCKPIVVYIPNSNFWRPDSKSESYKVELKSMSKEMNIKFINGEKVINKNNRDDYAPKGGHLSKKGFQKLAELISQEI